MNPFKLSQRLKEKLWIRLRVVYLAIDNLLFLKRNTVSAKDIPGLCGQKALIIGTGPSADRLSFELIRGYDVLVLINFAVLIPFLDKLDKSKYKLYFYSGDAYRLAQVSDEISVRLDIPSISSPFQITANKFSRLAPAFGRLYFLNVRNYDFLSIVYLVAKILLTGSGGWSISSSPQPLIDEVTAYIRNDTVACLPVAGSTSALSAMLMLANCGFSEIDLIGCDFNSGRSSTLASRLGSADFHLSDVANRFKVLSDLLRSFQVNVRNLSWNS